ncbi:hypothetical protein D3C86_1821180 [compost metagenome]
MFEQLPVDKTTFICPENDATQLEIVAPEAEVLLAVGLTSKSVAASKILSFSLLLAKTFPTANV